jgi:Flp pilus assembly protein CpaB
MGRRTIVLVVALLLAALSAFAVFNYLSSVEDDIRADITEVKVFRAVRGIPSGTAGNQAAASIEESTALLENIVFDNSTILCTGPVNADDPADVCINNPANLGDVLNGKVAAGPISAGQLITTQMFISPVELQSVSLSESLQEGTVAIAIRPSDVASVGGFIRPGDKINIIASSTVNITQTLEFLTDPELRQLLIDAGFIVPFSDIALPDITTPDFPVDTGGDPFQPAPSPDDPTVTDPLTAFVSTLPTSFPFTQTPVRLQNLEVLAVGADTRPSPLGTGLAPQGSQIMILEVTFEQAELIQFVQNNTSFAMMLLPSNEDFAPYTIRESLGVIIDDVFDVVSRIESELEAAFGTN